MDMASWVVSPQGGFSLSLFCNYMASKVVTFKFTYASASPAQHEPDIAVCTVRVRVVQIYYCTT